MGYLPWPVFETMSLRGVFWEPARSERTYPTPRGYVYVEEVEALITYHPTSSQRVASLRTTTLTSLLWMTLRCWKAISWECQRKNWQRRWQSWSWSQIVRAWASLTLPLSLPRKWPSWQRGQPILPRRLLPLWHNRKTNQPQRPQHHWDYGWCGIGWWKHRGGLLRLHLLSWWD